MLTAVALLLSSASLPDGDVAACEAWIRTRHSGDTPMVHAIGPATLCVDTNSVGLTADLATSFAAHMARIARDHRPRIVIRSLGGDVRYGLTMGEALAGRRASVFVSMFCGSSCANYIFLAAPERHISRVGSCSSTAG